MTAVTPRLVQPIHTTHCGVCDSVQLNNAQLHMFLYFSFEFFPHSQHYRIHFCPLILHHYVFYDLIYHRDLPSHMTITMTFTTIIKLLFCYLEHLKPYILIHSLGMLKLPHEK